MHPTVDKSVNESNRAFDIAREVEKLGEIIASRLNNATPVIDVNYPSLGRNHFVNNFISELKMAVDVSKLRLQYFIRKKLLLCVKIQHKYFATLHLINFQKKR